MPSLISCLVFLKNHVQRNRFVFVIIFVELLLIYHSTTGPQAPITYFQCVLDSVSTCRDERGKFWGCLDIAVQSPWALVNFPNTTDIKQCQGEMRKEDWRGGWLGGLGSLDKTVKDTWTLGPLWAVLRCHRYGGRSRLYSSKTLKLQHQPLFFKCKLCWSLHRCGWPVECGLLSKNKGK